MEIISRDRIRHMLQFVVFGRQKSRGETFFYFHAKAKDCCWGNNEELREQMIKWKKLRKEGYIEFKEQNNLTKKIFGEEWYICVLQPTNLLECPSFDICGMGFDDESYLITGHIYFFKRIENRDAVFKYVMGK